MLLDRDKRQTGWSLGIGRQRPIRSNTGGGYWEDQVYILVGICKEWSRGKGGIRIIKAYRDLSTYLGQLPVTSGSNHCISPRTCLISLYNTGSYMSLPSSPKVLQRLSTGGYHYLSMDIHIHR